MRELITRLNIYINYQQKITQHTPQAKKPERETKNGGEVLFQYADKYENENIIFISLK